MESMEYKKLNLDQPFLSVRRASPAAKDDPRKPASVSSVLPRLPPRRSDSKSGPFNNPGTVPFHWEQIPGQPKDGRQHSSSDMDRLTNESSEDIREKTEEEDECSEWSDSCDAFTDALSRTESLFFNCSMSDFSEFGLKMKASESVSSNSKNREIMMDRFLPAAKAMASEAPQYVHKKQHVIEEQKPQQLRKILMNKQPLLRYGPSFADRYSHEEEVSSDEEEDDDDKPVHLSATCGLLHRICVRNSIYLNPLPGMKMRSRLSSSPLSKVQPRSSSSGSHSETENESKSDGSIQIVELKEARSRLRTEHGHNESTYFDPPVSFLEDEQVLGVHRETKNPGNGPHKGRCKTFRDFLADQDNQDEIDSDSSVIEKTLYVDTIHKMESADNLPSPRTHVMRSLNQMHSSNSSEDLNKPRFMDVEASFLPVDDANAKEVELHKPATENKKVTEKRVDKFQVPTLSLKSPSDSWLSRTLPAASRKALPRHLTLSEQSKVRQNNSKRHPPEMASGTAEIYIKLE